MGLNLDVSGSYSLPQGGGAALGLRSVEALCLSPHGPRAVGCSLFSTRKPGIPGDRSLSPQPNLLPGEEKPLAGGGTSPRRPCPGTTAFPTELLIPCDLGGTRSYGAILSACQPSLLQPSLCPCRGGVGGLGGGRGECWGGAAAAKAGLQAASAADSAGRH